MRSSLGCLALVLLVVSCSNFAPPSKYAARATCGADASKSEETCDGQDNDCDDAIDEGFNVGQKCSKGVGACKSEGVMVCQPDGTSDCDAQPGRPADKDVCDGRDDDCDGSTDEDCPCIPNVSAPLPCGLGVGECGVGRQICVPDGSGTARYGACQGAGSKTTEICDGKDNDCDGVIDDGFAVGDICWAGEGACRQPGLSRCDARDPTAKPICSAVVGKGVAEVCNGIDDDCDGAVDNLKEKVACSVGVGECKRDGFLECRGDGFGAGCSAQPAAPQAETCNGKDDDCDGRVDESIDGAGKAQPACGCAPETLALVNGPDPGLGPDMGSYTQCEGSTTLCPLDVSQRPTMSFCLGRCLPATPWWVQCKFGFVDLSRFDADHGSQGAIEIVFRTSVELPGELNLYYGVHPKRKRLSLFRPGTLPGTRTLPPGEYRIVRGSAEAECPNEPGVPDACRSCLRGRWKDRDSACPFTTEEVQHAKVYLALETNCVNLFRDTEGLVTLVSLRYFPDACICTTAADCRDPLRPSCDKSEAIPDFRRCAANDDCSGLCVSR